MLPPPPDPAALREAAAVARRRLAAVAVEEAEERIWDRVAADEARRARRLHRRSVAYAPPRCAVCHRFKTSPRAACAGCGFDPAVGWAA